MDRNTIIKAGFLLLGTLALGGCGNSPPPKLFLLNGAVNGSAGYAEASVGSGSARSATPSSRSATSIDVDVVIPQYLDRPDIMIRATNYELAPLPNARWAEGLAVTASRALADDLRLALPAYKVSSSPSGSGPSDGYRIAVELANFEADNGGTVVLAGKWSIIDVATGRERQSFYFRNTAKAAAVAAQPIAEAMSGLLAQLSSQIARQIETLRIAPPVKAG